MVYLPHLNQLGSLFRKSHFFPSFLRLAFSNSNKTNYVFILPKVDGWFVLEIMIKPSVPLDIFKWPP